MSAARLISPKNSNVDSAAYEDAIERWPRADALFFVSSGRSKPGVQHIRELARRGTATMTATAGGPWPGCQRRAPVPKRGPHGPLPAGRARESGIHGRMGNRCGVRGRRLSRKICRECKTSPCLGRSARRDSAPMRSRGGLPRSGARQGRGRSVMIRLGRELGRRRGRIWHRVSFP
jgi:hypothetical protein